jgi:hypothetical protein
MGERGGYCGKMQSGKVLMSQIEQIHSVAHDLIRTLQDEHSFSENDAEDLAYECLAEALQDERFKHLKFLLYKLPDTVKVEKVDETIPEYDLKVLREIVTKVALRMLKEQQDQLEKEKTNAREGKEAEKN